MKFFFTISFLILTQSVFCQFQKIFNQSIELKDEPTVNIDLNGEVNFEEWDGSFILIETKVTLYNANDNIFKSFVKNGRYLTNVFRNEAQIDLVSHKDLGRKIKTSLGETSEDVVFKIYYPSKFKKRDKKLIIDTSQSMSSSIQGNQ